MGKQQDNIALLQSIKIFNSLQITNLKTILEYCSINTFADDTTIQYATDISNAVTIIKTGSIVVSKQQDNSERFIAEYIAGEAFGEANILFPKKTNVIIKTSGNSEVISFPKPGTNFISFKEQHPEIASQIIYNQLALTARRIRQVNSLVAEKTGWMQDLRNQLLVDKLTGLYNTTFLNEDFVNDLPNYGSSSCFIMIKPDQFKLINDSLGHEAGDAIIQKLAKELKQYVNQNGHCVRYRGNENAVILPDCKYADGMQFAKELMQHMQELDLSTILQEFTFDLSFSMSIAAYPKHAQRADGLIEKSFKLLYQGIEKGGNTITSPELEN